MQPTIQEYAEAIEMARERLKGTNELAQIAKNKINEIVDDTNVNQNQREKLGKLYDTITAIERNTHLTT